MSDGIPYSNLIFLALIAIFVALRLRAMLGKGGNRDPLDVWKQATRDFAQDKPPAFSERTAKKTSGDEDVLPANLQQNAPVATGLRAIRTADANFSTVDFLAGAKLAFEWVVDAFSKGDKDKLKTLLSDERYHHFAEEIELRGKDGLKHETTLVAVLATDITEAKMAGTKAEITVQFTSEQVSITRDKNNAIVAGDLSAIDKVIDVWTFERDTASRDPNWKIVAT